MSLQRMHVVYNSQLLSTTLRKGSFINRSLKMWQNVGLPMFLTTDVLHSFVLQEIAAHLWRLESGLCSGWCDSNPDATLHLNVLIYTSVAHIFLSHTCLSEKLRSSALLIYFLYNNASRCAVDRGLYSLIWRAAERSLAWGWYVSISLFLSLSTAVPSLTYSDSLPAADNTPNNRWATAGRKEIAWPYCLPSPPLCSSQIKGFLINWKVLCRGP